MDRNEHLATASAGYSYLDDGIPTNNRWLYEAEIVTKDEDTGYPFAEAQAKLAKILVDHTFLAINDAAVARYVETASISDGDKKIPATTTISVTPSKTVTANKVYIFDESSIANSGNDVLTFLPIMVSNTMTPKLNTVTHLDDGSSINLIDANFAKMNGFMVRNRTSVIVSGVNGQATITEEALVYVTLMGRGKDSNEIEAFSVLLPYAINPVPMKIPMLTARHVMSWLHATTTTAAGQLAASGHTSVGRPEWPHRISIKNLTQSKCHNICRQPWSTTMFMQHLMSSKVEINSVEKHFLPPLGELCLEPLQGPQEPTMTATEEVNIHDILTATEDAIEKAAAERRKELEEREKIRLEEIHNAQFIPNYNDLDAIIKDWETIPKDDIDNYFRETCTETMSELRPTFFPEEYWQYVPDIDKPLVKDRYKGYTEERKAEIIILFTTQLYSRICD